jgi:HPt (histidine-containing phosphotransfer) domain-containing protein
MMSDATARMAAKLQALWESSKASIVGRFEALHAAQARLTVDPLDAEARQKGHDEAHKLAGVLGVFGMPQGSEMAAQIEALLDDAGPLDRQHLEALSRLTDLLGAVIAAKASPDAAG